MFLHGTSPSYNSGLMSRLNPFSPKAKQPSVVFKESGKLALGDCWSFQGSTGHISVLLAAPVIPTHFEIEHIGNMDGLLRNSAPRHVRIFGIDDRSEHLVAEYEYTLDGPAIQNFPASLPLLQRPVNTIRLDIISNHGHPDYTCLYRFRVFSTVSKIQ